MGMAALYCPSISPFMAVTCTWTLAKLSRWALADEGSPVGLVAHTLHVPWTRLLQAGIGGAWAECSCNKVKHCQGSTEQSMICCNTRVMKDHYWLHASVQAKNGLIITITTAKKPQHTFIERNSFWASTQQNCNSSFPKIALNPVGTYYKNKLLWAVTGL